MSERNSTGTQFASTALGCLAATHARARARVAGIVAGTITALRLAKARSAVDQGMGPFAGDTAILSEAAHSAGAAASGLPARVARIGVLTAALTCRAGACSAVNDGMAACAGAGIGASVSTG